MDNIFGSNQQTQMTFNPMFNFDPSRKQIYERLKLKCPSLPAITGYSDYITKPEWVIRNSTEDFLHLDDDEKNLLAMTKYANHASSKFVILNIIINTNCYSGLR